MYVCMKSSLNKCMYVCMYAGNSCASIEDGVDWMHALMRDVDIPRLRYLCEGRSTLLYVCMYVRKDSGSGSSSSYQR